MKVLIVFFAAVGLLTVARPAAAQEKLDSIKVYYENKNTLQHGIAPEFYVDSVLVKNAFIETFKPTQIAKIDVVKEGPGKIYITLKKDVPYKFVTLQSLGEKYLKNNQRRGVLYTVDGKLITDAESIINEKDILSVSIAADQTISSLSAGTITLLKVLTRSKENIDRANTIYIRGNTIGSR